MNKQILIVDDDKMLCTVFEMFLRDAGYTNVGIVQAGEEAIEFCKITKPDIVLMDIRMQGEMDGIETSKQLVKLYNIPIVYVTSDIELETIRKSVVKNIYGFLVKPVLPVTLKTTIEFACAKFKYDNENKNC